MVCQVICKEKKVFEIFCHSLQCLLHCICVHRRRQWFLFQISQKIIFLSLKYPRSTLLSINGTLQILSTYENENAVTIIVVQCLARRFFPILHVLFHMEGVHYLITSDLSPFSYLLCPQRRQRVIRLMCVKSKT